MKLALGTVQLGIPYGIANQNGMPDETTALEILRAARDTGHEWLDTAAAYGQSESVLGRLVPETWKGQRPKIATKITLREDTPPQAQIEESLRKLACDSVEAVLLHNEADLDHPRFAEFTALPSSGRVQLAGVSIYDPNRALQGIHTGLQCLQVPCNLFDTSSVDAGVFEKAREHGVLVFVRSIFLQGLFFLSPDHERAQRIPGAVEALRFLHDFCYRHAISPAQLALAFGASLTDAVIVLGAEAAAQIHANAALANEAVKHLDVVAKWLRERPSIPKSVFTPGTWPAA